MAVEETDQDHRHDHVDSNAAPFISKNKVNHHLTDGMKDPFLGLWRGTEEWSSLMATLLVPTCVRAPNGLGFTNSSSFVPVDFQSRISQQGTCGSVCSSGQSKQWRVVCKKDEDRTPPTAEASPIVKLAWYGSEAFGNAVSIFRPKSAATQAIDEGEQTFDGPVERTAAVELIKKDYERSYFVTGNMATGIYEEDCEFADPFVSFKGLKRFKQTVGNLGSFMEESTLKVTDWQEYEDRIYARWRFSCVLALPWRPILAASGSTEYFFSKDSGKILKHVESWDISPAEGVRQLLKPNSRAKKERVKGETADRS